MRWVNDMTSCLVPVSATRPLTVTGQDEGVHILGFWELFIVI